MQVWATKSRPKTRKDSSKLQVLNKFMRNYKNSIRLILLLVKALRNFQFIQQMKPKFYNVKGKQKPNKIKSKADNILITIKNDLTKE